MKNLAKTLKLEGKEWIFEVNIRSPREDFGSLELHPETFGNIYPSVVCLSDAWISEENEFQILRLNNYLPPKYHAGCNRKDGVVVYVHEFIKYEVVCTDANICHNIFKTVNKNNQCFVVVCMYISLSFKRSSILKEVELLHKNISILMGSPVSIGGDMNIDLLKQDNLSNNYSNLLQYNGMTRLLMTSTRITKDSATLIDPVFHNHFSAILDCGILDADLTEHCATFRKLPFLCKKCDDTRTTFLLYIMKMQNKPNAKHFQRN